MYGSYKLGCQMWGSNFLREKPGVMSALPLWPAIARMGYYRTVSAAPTDFDVCALFPFICLVCKSSSVTEFLSEEMCFLYSCSFGVPMGEVILAFSSVTILNQNYH